MIQSQFFDYKMVRGDSVALHIAKIENIAKTLSNLGKPIPTNMIITKILCSLPPSFSIVNASWDNVPVGERTIENLTVHLLQLEHLNASQGNTLGDVDTAFFWKTLSLVASNPSIGKKDY